MHYYIMKSLNRQIVLENISIQNLNVILLEIIQNLDKQFCFMRKVKTNLRYNHYYMMNTVLLLNKSIHTFISRCIKT